MITPDNQWLGEPRLSADFAARVLDRADAIRARRRRMQIATAAAAGALLVALIAGPRVAPTPTREIPGAATASSGSGADFLADFNAERGSSSGDFTSASGRAEDADALTYLFPDAAPLARFADEYSGAAHGMEIEGESLSSDEATGGGEQL